MKRTLWVFGDSFCNYYIEEMSKLGIIQWPTLVSNSLHTHLKNFGKGGNSNYCILQSVLTNLPKVTPNDYLVIGTTDCTRIHRVNTSKEVKPYISEKKVFIDNPKWFSRRKPVSALEPMDSFVLDELLPHAESYTEWWNEAFDGLKSHLQQIGYKVIVFGTDMWSKFESIQDSTKGEILDKHWSKKGHQDFAKYICEKFDKKVGSLKNSSYI